MNRCNLKLFSEKTPVIISFQNYLSTKSANFKKEISKANIQTFQKAIPNLSGDNDNDAPRKPILYKLDIQEKKRVKNSTDRNHRYPLAGDCLFAFPAISNSMKYNRSIMSVKEYSRPQAKLLKGQNQLIYEKLKDKFYKERKEKSNEQRKTIKTEIAFFNKCHMTKAINRDHYANNKNQISIEQNVNKIAKNKVKTTLNFFKKCNSAIALKGIEKTPNIENQPNHDYNICKDKMKGTSYPNKNTSLSEVEQISQKESNTFDKFVQTNEKNEMITSKTENKYDMANTQCNNNIQIEKQSEPIQINNCSIPKEKEIKDNINNNDNDNDNEGLLDNHNLKEINTTDKEFISESNTKKMRSSSSFTLKDINVSNIINKVLENNKKAAEASSKHLFSEIGKNFKSNHMSQSNINFFSANNSAKHSIPSLKQPKNQNSLNTINIQLINPLEWKKHEEAWTLFQSLYSINSSIEFNLIPPNDNEVLISSYYILFPSIINRTEYSKAESLSTKKDYCLSFTINDKIQNPKIEMRKWKDAYKRVVLRWHPDKLLGKLSYMNIKENETLSKLKKKCSSIINNTNVLYKNIMETLNKILQFKAKHLFT